MKEQAEVRELKEGRYMLIDDEPCKIVAITTSKPGKHGAAKARIDATSIFTGAKKSYTGSVTDRIYIPMIDKRSAQILALMGEQVQLMDKESFDVFELPVPEDLKGQLQPGNEILYLEAMGRRKITRA